EGHERLPLPDPRPLPQGSPRGPNVRRRAAPPVRHAGRGRRDRRARAVTPLDSRVVLVTGAQRGIGFACAEAFVAAGARVACVDLPDGDLPAAVDGLGPAASAHQADVAEVDHADRLVAEVVSRHGRLDVLVSAAGTLAPAPFLELTREQWDRTLDVNVRGTVFLAQACVRHFVSAGTGGRI